MTDEKINETDTSQNESKSDNQNTGAVRKRLTLTIAIVVLMAIASVASVYRQEIYVGVVRTFTNLKAQQTEVKTTPEQKLEQETSGSQLSDAAPKPIVESIEPSRLAMDQAPLTQMPSNVEVNKSVIEVPKNASHEVTQKNVPTPESSSDKSKTETETSKTVEKSNKAEASPEKKDNNVPLKNDKLEVARENRNTDPGNMKTGISDTATQAASEQFQVPGSLKVRIDNYSGSLTKWRLMIILDDSNVMAKEVKPWSPDRFATATTFISKLSSQVTTGSKLSVRDFACVKKDDKKSAPCLSRVIFEWSESPFSGLKDKLQAATPGGVVNPCAAAAYSMKKDFLVSDGLRPRLLLVTCGSVKCNTKDVLKAAGAIGPNAKTPVDVVAVGMNSKGKSAYSNLAKKTGGIFIAVDNPGDLENGVKKYSKNLQVVTLDKIEVRGEKIVFSVNPDEDITLAPGIYTVVLPSIKGLAEFKRSVPNVRIKSGEGTVMTVKLSKGKASVKIGSK